MNGAIAEGMTAKGIFGGKLMWDQLPGLIAKLRAAHGYGGEDERALLQRAFPGLRLIWLRREDSLAQAVSLSRAVQTNKWFSFQPGSLRVREPWGGPHPEPRFDFAHINAMAHAVRRETEGWFQWFGANRIEPFRVRYEDLVEDMEGTTRSVLSFLGVELPNGAVTEPQDEKQADSVNAEWIARYRAMARDAADQRRGA